MKQPIHEATRLLGKELHTLKNDNYPLFFQKLEPNKSSIIKFLHTQKLAMNCAQHIGRVLTVTRHKAQTYTGNDERQ